MKKLFLSLLLLGMTFCSFARAFFAYDDTGIQFSYDSNESSFDHKFIDVAGMSVLAGWASQMLLDNGFINGLYNQNTLDLVLMLKNRRIFYIGAGISDYNLFDFAYKNSSKKNGFYTTTIGYHFIGGIRL